MKALWPSERFPAERKVNVLNISQKTENDMSAWSQTMEAERERLTAEVCNELCFTWEVKNATSGDMPVSA